MCEPVDESWTEADDVIEEVREIRRQIFARYDNDLDKLFDHYMEYQKQYAHRFWDPRASSTEDKSAA